MPPSYLVHQRGPVEGDGVSVDLDLDASLVLLSVQGAWSSSLKRDVCTAMLKCLGEHPAALIVDLQAMTDPRGASVATWLRARHLGEAMEPAVQVVLCLPPDSALAHRLQRLGAERFLPVFPSVALARSAAAQRLPMTSRLRLLLPANSSASAVARAVVTDVCTAWRMSQLRDRACQVITELVRNAVTHAGAPVSVLLSRRSKGVHLAVRDGDPRLPRLVEGSGGSGLQLVQRTASVWGSIPAEGGKVVWAVIYPRAGSE